MSGGGKYRSRGVPRVIGLSVSYQRENLLARGLGLEHLRELLLRLSRPLLRHGASLAYAGHWRETEDNFTYDLLRMINAEQEDNSHGGADTGLNIGRLYNHSPWPDFLDITPRIEAQWINSCRIVRISQELAGIASDDRVSDGESQPDSNRARLNVALVLSAMRRMAVEGMTVAIPDVPSPETVPPISARVLLGGKLQGFSGFLPGVFEEALVALEHKLPLYVLGGFGGAAETLAQALLAPASIRPDAFSFEWHRANSSNFEQLVNFSQTCDLPSGVRTSAQALDALYQLIGSATSNLVAALNTGLNEAQTKELLTTRDMGRAVKLVLSGLKTKFGLELLPS